MDWQCIIYMPVCINICDLSHKNVRKHKEHSRVRGHIFHQKNMFQIIKNYSSCCFRTSQLCNIYEKSLQQNMSMIFKLTQAWVTTMYACKRCQHAGRVKMEYILYHT